MNSNYSYPVAAVGFSALIQERYPIASVSVDNPSGVWVYIPEAYALIPPASIGMQFDINPTVSSIRVQYVSAPPNGVAPSVSGGPVIVTTYDRPQGNNSGLNYTVATQQDLANVLAVLEGVLANTGALFTPLWNNKPIHAGSITTINIPNDGASHALGLANPPTNPERMWYSDDQWSTPNNVRNNGYWIQPGQKELLVIVGFTNIQLVSETVDMTVRVLTSFIGS